VGPQNSHIGRNREQALDDIGAGVDMQEQLMLSGERDDLRDHVQVNFTPLQDVQLTQTSVAAGRNPFGKKVEDARFL
jgi:hypothetical protein